MCFNNVSIQSVYPSKYRVLYDYREYPMSAGAKVKPQCHILSPPSRLKFNTLEFYSLFPSPPSLRRKIEHKQGCGGGATVFVGKKADEGCFYFGGGGNKPEEVTSQKSTIVLRGKKYNCGWGKI